MQKNVEIRSSTTLYNFYVQYLHRVQNEAGVDKYHREHGLCFALRHYFYLSGAMEVEYHELYNEMLDQFNRAGLQLIYPFSSCEDDYEDEVCRGECHLNPQRIEWVKARIKDGEY